MRPVRYSTNATLDKCCDHRAIPADEDLDRHAVDNLAQAVVSSTLDRVGSNVDLVRGNLETAVQQLKRESVRRRREAPGWSSGAVAMRYEPRR